MHATFRTFLGGAAFLGVSILSAVEQAPYVQAGDDAEAFTGDGPALAGRQGDCRQECAQRLPEACKGPKASECLEGCYCDRLFGRQQACSARQPCPGPKEGKEGKQACMEGLCLHQCSSDKECSSVGGVCRAGSCRQRTTAEVASCKAACEPCIARLKACAAKYNACNCPPR
jgi:hypothetical protein